MLPLNLTDPENLISETMNLLNISSKSAEKQSQYNNTSVNNTSEDTTKP